MIAPYYQPINDAVSGRFPVFRHDLPSVALYQVRRGFTTFSFLCRIFFEQCQRWAESVFFFKAVCERGIEVLKLDASGKVGATSPGIPHVYGVFYGMYVRCMFVVYIWYLYGIFMVSLWYAYGMIMVFDGMLMVCLWFVHGMFMVLWWYVYGMLMVYLL